MVLISSKQLRQETHRPHYLREFQEQNSSIVSLPTQLYDHLSLGHLGASSKLKYMAEFCQVVLKYWIHDEQTLKRKLKYTQVAKAPVPLIDEHKACAKKTQRTIKVSELAPFVFIRSNIDKTVQNLRKPNGKERTRAVCSRDVKQMNIGNGPFGARICCRLTSLTEESSSVQKVLCSSKLFTRMKSQYGRLMGKEYEIRTQEFTTNALRFSTDGKNFFYVFYPLLHLPVQWDRPL